MGAGAMREFNKMYKDNGVPKMHKQKKEPTPSDRQLVRRGGLKDGALPIKARTPGA